MIDYFILGFVLIVIGLIVYFRFIKKDSKNLSCNCYKAKNCGLKINELKDLFSNEK